MNDLNPTNGHTSDVDSVADAAHNAAGDIEQSAADATESIAGATDRSSDESLGWTGDEPAGGDARATGERMVGQLQAMIDSLATQAAPVARQIGAKAAELAAAAADRAGPLAIRAADATADASEKLAVRSRTWAAELRQHNDEASDGTNDVGGDSGGGVAIAEAEDSVASHHDDPVEGPRD